MTLDGRNTNEELINSIHEYYGFEKEQITNPEQCGLWHVRFEVKGIKYYGSIPFHGALPTLKSAGYTTKNYYHDTPIEDWFYKEYIEGKQVKIIKYIDADAGDWEDTGIIVDNQEKAKEYIASLENSEDYYYDVIN